MAEWRAGKRAQMGGIERTWSLWWHPARAMMLGTASLGQVLALSLRVSGASGERHVSRPSTATPHLWAPPQAKMLACEGRIAEISAYERQRMTRPNAEQAAMAANLCAPPKARNDERVGEASQEPVKGCRDKVQVRLRQVTQVPNYTGHAMCI